MEIRVYICENFRNEETTIYQAKTQMGVFTKNLDKESATTLAALYKEGWRLRTVSLGAGTFAAIQFFYMEKE